MEPGSAGELEAKPYRVPGQDEEKHLQNYLNTSGAETFLRPVNDVAFAREAEWYGQGCSPRLQLSTETVVYGLCTKSDAGKGGFPWDVYHGKSL